jgi:hypothetical protein
LGEAAIKSSEPVLGKLAPFVQTLDLQRRIGRMIFDGAAYPVLDERHDGGALLKLLSSRLTALPAVVNTYVDN